MRTITADGANGRLHIKLGDSTAKDGYDSRGLPKMYNQPTTMQTTLVPPDSEVSI